LRNEATKNFPLWIDFGGNLRIHHIAYPAKNDGLK